MLWKISRGLKLGNTDKTFLVTDKRTYLIRDFKLDPKEMSPNRIKSGIPSIRATYKVIFETDNPLNLQEDFYGKKVNIEGYLSPGCFIKLLGCIFSSITENKVEINAEFYYVYLS